MESGLRIRPKVDFNYNTRFTTQLTPEAQKEDWVGVTAAFPLRYQANAQLVIDQGPWQAELADSLPAGLSCDADGDVQRDLELNQGGSHVAGQDYHDAFGRWSARES